MSVRVDTPLLPVYTLGPKSVVWWGILGLVAIELVVFSGFIAMYFWLKLVNPSWPPDGISRPDLLLPTINTLVLIASGAAMVYAKRAIVRGNQLGLKVGQGLALLLGIVFLIIKVVEYSAYGFDWSTHAYGSIVWTITGFHSAHVVSVVMKGFVVFAMALRGMFLPDRHLAFEVSTIYWAFVVVIWLPLYFTMYISPRL